jgi:SAM-dependent methyltransferase
VSEAATKYDRIGRRYRSTRRGDPRLAAAINDALGDATSVLNVGAGTGSYEPGDRRLVAVEPSEVMIAQRPPGSAPAVRAVAEALPFGDGSFDACLAILTLHHWADPRKGLAELRRVARLRVVVMTSDPTFLDSFWLTQAYFPAIAELDRRRVMPVDRVISELGGGRVVPVPIPHDCSDGFTRAFWRRPWAYLDPRIRRGMSTFAEIGERERAEGIEKLAEDLASGAWHERFGHVLGLDELDLGYLLIVAET